MVEVGDGGIEEEIVFQMDEKVSVELITGLLEISD
jgi:hypothetical protein|tara:strand:- start:281 stop:385 length:105 start_codon:yes stop_codon:yes gene_type:complete